MKRCEARLNIIEHNWTLWHDVWTLKKTCFQHIASLPRRTIVPHARHSGLRLGLLVEALGTPSSVVRNCTGGSSKHALLCITFMFLICHDLSGSKWSKYWKVKIESDRTGVDHFKLIIYDFPSGRLDLTSFCCSRRICECNGLGHPRTTSAAPNAHHITPNETVETPRRLTCENKTMYQYLYCIYILIILYIYIHCMTTSGSGRLWNGCTWMNYFDHRQWSCHCLKLSGSIVWLDLPQCHPSMIYNDI